MSILSILLSIVVMLCVLAGSAVALVFFGEWALSVIQSLTHHHTV